MGVLLALCILFAIQTVDAKIKATNACQHPVKAEHGTVCLCVDVEECVRLPKIPEDGTPLIVTTYHDGAFMEVTPPSLNEDAQMKIDIQSNVTFQEIFGFGGAVTDSTALQYTNLQQTSRNAFANAFYDEENGAGFTYARVPMNSADFSRKNYVHASKLDLSDWCLRDDSEPSSCGNDYKITPTLQDIVSKRSDLKVYISSWSAPPDFKDQRYDCKKVDGLFECEQNSIDKDMNCTRTVSVPSTCNSQNKQGEPCQTSPPRDNEPSMSKDPKQNADGNCYNAGFLREDTMKAWARFYEKYVNEVNDAIEPLKVWGVTSQNEPLTQTGLWQSNFMSEENETRFVGTYLSPILKQSFGDIKIMVHDDQVVSLTSRALKVAQKLHHAVDGVAYHWYQALEGTFENTPPESPLNLPSWIVANKVGGGADVKTVYDAFNGTKFMLMTEACSGYSLGTSWVGPRHGEWGYGYATSHDILWQLRNRASGWIYWNLMLDEIGGPNLAGNYVDSPSYRINSTSFALNPSFFHMAHFSRYVVPGSFAVHADVQCGARRQEYCQFVAFKRPDDKLVVIMTNDEITAGPIAGTGVGIAITPWLAKGQGSLTLGSKTLTWQINCGGGSSSNRTVSGTLPWKSIQTVVC